MTLAFQTFENSFGHTLGRLVDLTDFVPQVSHYGDANFLGLLFLDMCVWKHQIFVS